MSSQNEMSAFTGIAIPEPETTSIVEESPLAMLQRQHRIEWCSVPLASEQGLDLLEALIGKPSLQKEEAYNRDLEIVAVLIQGPGGADPETGEVYTTPRCVVLLADGSTLRFVSTGIFQSVGLLAMMRPRGLWTPPIRVRLKAIDVGQPGPKLVFERVKTPVVATKEKWAKNGK